MGKVLTIEINKDYATVRVTHPGTMSIGMDVSSLTCPGTRSAMTRAFADAFRTKLDAWLKQEMKGLGLEDDYSEGQLCSCMLTPEESD